jgi:hypothetical protein
LRGDHGLPGLIAARFISRMAAICRAWDLVSSRRLRRPTSLAHRGEIFTHLFSSFYHTEVDDAS